MGAVCSFLGAIRKLGETEAAKTEMGNSQIMWDQRDNSGTILCTQKQTETKSACIYGSVIT